MGHEVKKRTKPCISCKLAKVKCEYTDSLPCKRCIRLGIHCQFAPDSRSVPIPIPVVPPLSQMATNAPVPRLIQHRVTEPGKQQSPVPTAPSYPALPPHTHRHPHSTPNQNFSMVTNGQRPVPDQWAQNLDSRMKNFENMLENMYSALYDNKVEQQSRMDRLQNDINSQATLTHNFITSQRNSRQANVRLPNLSALEPTFELTSTPTLQGTSGLSTVERSIETAPMKPCCGNENTQDKSGLVDEPSDITDFRKYDIITKDEARLLLDYFSEFFGPHLFGFTPQAVPLDSLWDDSPLLLVAICTVACSHHPELCERFCALHSSLHWFASQLLFSSNSEINVEHTILGLVIASLWLSSCKMFSSLALQLSRIWRIDQLYSPETEKIWFLLYILDGTQNLMSHKSPSIYKDMEPLLKNSRRSVIEKLDKTTSEGKFFRRALLEYNQRKKHTATHKQLELLNEVRSEKLKLDNATFQDLRLLTQLEYHMAMESVFHNKNTYIPSLHDESLEATMTLLPTEKFGIPWTNNMDLDKWMISWTIALQNIKVQNDPWCFKSTLLYYNFARMHINTKALLQGKKSSLLDDLRNTELIDLWRSHPSAIDSNHQPANSSQLSASKEISRSSAIALLKLATKDKDIAPIFQFFPVHIYIMLYYASLVVLNPSMIAEISEKDAKQSYALVTNFKKLLQTATITDKPLKTNLNKALNQLLVSFKQELSNKDRNSRQVYELIDQNVDNGTTTSQKKRPILAWPGTNHGHP